jgi:formate hydrogenlyase subunit 6/NADH:ubiquinone oxidoreductase subunit I
MALRTSYFSDLIGTTRTVWRGLTLTWRQMWRSRRTNPATDVRRAGYFAQTDGIATVAFPHRTLPVPEVGRYRLHNEMDDCIVCDKCAKICPVNCIEIEPIRSPEEFGKTSDGTPKRIHAAKFNIDLAKCCFCGLCTTVCPTECLTMTPEFDFSTFDIRTHDVAFAHLPTDEIEKLKAQWAQHESAKAAAAASAPKPTGARPTPRPRIAPGSPPA